MNKLTVLLGVLLVGACSNKHDQVREKSAQTQVNGCCDCTMNHVWVGKVHYLVFRFGGLEPAGLFVMNYTHDSTEVEFENTYGDKNK